MPAFSTFSMPSNFNSPKQVAVVGYGSWGSAIARLVGKTITQYPDDFAPTVKMWVSEKMINGEKLTSIINTRHENVKYLPGKKLPHTVVAVPDLVDTCQDAQILLFVVPHQCIDDVVSQLEGKIDPNAIAVSLIKGVSSEPDGGKLKLISREIQERLNIDVSVLMGANLAPEVASDKFCEATIGSNASKQNITLLKKLFHSDNFRVNVVPDAASVELCGALKNVVACAAGFVDGLQSGDNTKAAVIRLGLMEITKFVEYYYPGARLSTFFESCGVADLVTSCYGGRNRRVCEAFVNCNKTMEEVEASLLNGQSAQGPLTAEDVYFLMKKTGMTKQFPLFTAVHKICKREIPAEDLIDCLRHHPEYTN